jgi:hypothetical protein
MAMGPGGQAQASGLQTTFWHHRISSRLSKADPCDVVLAFLGEGCSFEKPVRSFCGNRLNSDTSSPGDLMF